MSSRRTMMDGTRVSSMESPGSSRGTMWTRPSQPPNCVDTYYVLNNARLISIFRV